MTEGNGSHTACQAKTKNVFQAQGTERWAYHFRQGTGQSL